MKARPKADATSLEPLGDHLVIQSEDAEEIRPSGIVIPQTAQVRMETGVVLATGRGRQLQDGSKKPMEIKPGDRVIYSKYAGVVITYENQRLLLIAEKDVLCVYAQ
jgi:chaperonin GroES